MPRLPSDSLKVRSANAATPPSTADRPTHCTNCGAAVSGKYCSACGQSVEYHLHSLRHVLGEAAEVLTHADSRLWRTLGPLLFRPGFLTQQFLQGRRAGYLSPLRLYFVLSVLFFLVVSATGTLAPKAEKSPVSVHQTVGEARTELQARLGKSSDPEQKAAPLNRSQRPGVVAGNLTTADGGSTAAADAEGLCRTSVSTVPGPDWIRQQFVSACIRSQADKGRALNQSFIRNLGRAMFLFLPLLAALMKLLYWRPKRSFVTHLLLLVHNHAFVFLLMSVVLIALHWIHSGEKVTLLTGALMCYVIYYSYRSMQRVYAESWARTLVKLTALSVGYLACAACTVFLTGLYSAETM